MPKVWRTIACWFTCSARGSSLVNRGHGPYEIQHDGTLGRLIWNIVTLLLHCYIFPSPTSKNGVSSNLTSIFLVSWNYQWLPVTPVLHGGSEPLTKRRSEKSELCPSVGFNLVRLLSHWSTFGWIQNAVLLYIIYMYMLCYCNYISHLHFKQKIKVTTSFIWLRIRMDTIPLSLQWVASLRQIVLAITSGALNEIHGAGTVVWFVLWKAPGWEQVNYAYTSSYIYICMYTCVYVYMYICMYIYTHVYTRR